MRDYKEENIDKKLLYDILMFKYMFGCFLCSCFLLNATGRHHERRKKREKNGTKMPANLYDMSKLSSINFLLFSSSWVVLISLSLSGKSKSRRNNTLLNPLSHHFF